MIRQAPILLLLLGIGACTHSDGNPLPEPIARLENLLLAPPTSPLGDWLLVGRFEVTREEFGLAADVRGAHLPVVLVSYEEAVAWSEDQGLRLPTLREWQFLASDAGSMTSVSASARNGLHLNLGRPLPVGVFERGRTALGAYDFFGNVREWVFDPIENRFFACGGSFASADASALEWEQMELEPTERTNDVGFRYVANATTYFMTQVAPEWSSLDTAQRAEVILFLGDWRSKSRVALGARLRAAGAPRDLADLVSGA